MNFLQNNPGAFPAGLLTPDGLRVICAGLDNDSEKIGKHMLEMLAKFRNGGVMLHRFWVEIC